MISLMRVEPCTASTLRQPVSHGETLKIFIIRSVFPENPLPIIENIHKRNMKAGIAISK